MTLEQYHSIRKRIQIDLKTGCWFWDGAHNKSGYAYVSIDGKIRTVRVVVYGVEMGGIPSGKYLYCSCKNRACCNPEHMILDTQSEKVFRAHRSKQSDEDRFWGRVGKTESQSDCWEWMGEPYGDCYGLFWYQGKQQGAHRVAYQLGHGEIPKGLHVRHLCHNRRCCNPAHLAVGTSKENEADKMSAGRTATGDRNGSRKHPDRLRRGDNHPWKLHPELIRKGEDNHNAIFTNKEVIRMRESYFNKEMNLKELSKKYHANRDTIHRIVTGKNYPKIGGPIASTQPVAKLTTQEVKQIREKFDTGKYLQKELSEEYGVVVSAIHHIVTGKIWKDVGGPVQPVQKKSRLSIESVREIREIVEAGEYNIHEMAGIFKCHPETIRRVINNKVFANALQHPTPSRTSC